MDDRAEWDDVELHCAVHRHVRLQMAPDGGRFVCSACGRVFEVQWLWLYAWELRAGRSARGNARS